MVNDKDAKRRMRLIAKFFELEAAGGILLMAAAALALVAANTSGIAAYYDMLLAVPMEIRLGPLELKKNFLLVVNDGLMAIFFLLVALEIKREVLAGELSSFRQVILPGVAAAGGVICPALIYWYFNAGDSIAMRGWAIPAATDIAFSLAVLSLLGSRAPLALKVFLTTIAVIDDLAAIIIIAIFYTSKLSLFALAAGLLGFVALIVLNRSRVLRLGPYLLVGTIMWVCVLKSGVHATLAGVMLGFTIPFHDPESGKRPLAHLEHLLHPWVAYAILPLFAFANSGVSLSGLSMEMLGSGVTLGIALGLLLGKAVGVFGMSWLLIVSGIAKAPGGASYAQLLGVSILTGIGFTMSLFIGSLAFEDAAAELLTLTKIGVFSASLVAAGLGYLVLYLSLSRNVHPLSEVE